MAAADATRAEGFLPPSVDADKRVLLQRVPRGVVGVISPWNWPYTMPGEILAPAIAYGNAVVWAPAPSTSVCAVKLAECIEAGDLPPGVFNLVTGPGPVVGDEVAANPGTQAVGFIGSIATGRRVAERAAGKELLLEMGGNGPLVDLEDADLDRAVGATLVACFLNAGQSCTAGERILVHHDVHDAYVEKLLAAIAERIRLGDPFDDATTMGPLNNQAVAAKTASHVQEAVERGALLLAGGARAPSHGSELFFEATVVDDVTEQMAIAREETFGPVVPITAIRLRGRGDRARERLAVRIALGGLHARPRPRAPLRGGGANRLGERERGHELLGVASAVRRARRVGSGVGRVGGRFSMERLTELKTIVIDLG